MKYIILLLLFLPCIALGQQALWSTTPGETLQGEEIKHIPLESVTDEVLKFYDYYDWYFDGTGFTKKEFIKNMESASGIASSFRSNLKSLKDKLDGIENQTVFAMKGNDGKGSYVAVLHINKGNIDIIAFSNNLMGQGSESTSDDRKFRRWFDSLLGFKSGESNPLSLTYFGRQGEFGNASLSLENRRFVVSPKIDDDGTISGKIAVEIRVDRDGKIISARAGVRGTTISNNELFEKCERAAFAVQLSRLENAPPVQTGVIVFNFQLAEPGAN